MAAGLGAEPLSFSAPAKVNLCLAVRFPPQDGYHQLDSVFFELPLADRMAVRVILLEGGRPASVTSAGTVVSLDCGALDVAVRDNLVFKAVEGFEEALGARLAGPDEALLVHVEKNIPAGGGLGGGSSDAASMLRACCALAGVLPDDQRVQRLARSLGADVAFFLQGGTALMTGRGDVLEEALPAFPLPLVLMGESRGLSTPAIYRSFDEDPAPAGSALELASALRGFDPQRASRADKLRLAQLCSNNLEPAAFKALPSLRKRVERARADEDVLHALVTGSGATSFAICEDLDAARRFEQRARSYCSWTRVC